MAAPPAKAAGATRTNESARADLRTTPSTRDTRTLFELQRLDVDLARLRAELGPNDALLLHLLDDTGGAVVTDLQPALTTF